MNLGKKQPKPQAGIKAADSGCRSIELYSMQYDGN